MNEKLVSSWSPESTFLVDLNVPFYSQEQITHFRLCDYFGSLQLRYSGMSDSGLIKMIKNQNISWSEMGNLHT